MGASFVDKDGSKKVPVMLHRALFGSLERFIGILIENYSGKLPFWISPSQIMVIPVSEDFNDYSVEVNKKLIASGLNSEVDLEKSQFKLQNKGTFVIKGSNTINLWKKRS